MWFPGFMKLPAILSFIAKPAAPKAAAELRAMLAEPALDVPALDRALEDLDAARRGILLRGSDADLAVHDDKIRSAELATQRAAAAREEIERLLVEADAREAAAARASQRREAERLVVEARAAIETLGPTFSAVRAVLRSVAMAELAVARFNSALDQHSGERLLGPEDLRNTGRRREAVELERRPVSLWCWEGSGLPISPEQQPHVIPHTDTTGRLPPGGGRAMAIGATNHAAPVVKRRFMKITRLPSLVEDHLGSLAHTISLPPIMAGDPPGWAVPGRYVDTGDIIAEVDRIEAALAAKPVDTRTPVIVYEPVSDANLSEAA